jgi:predicted methyltransferase
MTMRRFSAIAVLVTITLSPYGLAAQEARDPISAAVASPARPAADVERDPLRKPAEVLHFAGVKPGDRVIDVLPGKGYFTRLFSGIVGSQGHVYAVIPAELLKLAPTLQDDMKPVTNDPDFGNVSVVVAPTASLATPDAVDVVWSSDAYHAIYGFAGADAADRLNQAIFKMLKPGGVYLVIDHAAKDGASTSSAKSLLRMDAATVKAQIIAAGFIYNGESGVLRNADDPHDRIVTAPEIRGRTDQFVMKFSKPN